MASHVDISETHDCIRGMGIQLESLLIFPLSVGEFIFFLENLSRISMRFRLFWLKLRRLPVSFQSLFWPVFLYRLPQRKPRAVVTLICMTGRFQLGRGPQ